MNATTIMTTERVEEYGPVARFGVEEFVSDNVVIVRNVLEGERRRRTIEILKFRGTTHMKGEYPFTITNNGVNIFPLGAMRLTQRSSNVRVSSGVKTLDDMCGGGFFKDSIILATGATGTGKTLLVSKFLKKPVSLANGRFYLPTKNRGRSYQETPIPGGSILKI